jgi:hypothetical protein
VVAKASDDDLVIGATLLTDVREHHSSWRGAAVEQLVAATIALVGRGRINVAQTLWDADGVDLLFEGPDHSVPRMRVQVKSIGTDTTNVARRRRAVSLVRDATFGVHDDTWVLFVLIDVENLTFEKSWLVPAADFAERANVNSRGYRRFADGIDSSRSIWTRYRFESRMQLARFVAERLAAL